MIYIIYDESQRYDDEEHCPIIRQITTNKKLAEEWFEKYYSAWKDLPNDKWTYRARLVEYQDNYNYFEFQASKELKFYTNEEKE